MYVPKRYTIEEGRKLRNLFREIYSKAEYECGCYEARLFIGLVMSAYGLSVVEASKYVRNRFDARKMSAAYYWWLACATQDLIELYEADRESV